MKKSILKCLGTGQIVLVLSGTFHQQAAAQVDRPVPVVTDNDDDGFDWSWLGLLGLLGLGGLAGLNRDRKHSVPVTSVK